uniref:Ig-like domain-containing protein n=1 Tax=Erpetoichthys calabaricus TaxID=27687 RepID=A0A8C4RS15_ERPCA
MSEVQGSLHNHGYALCQTSVKVSQSPSHIIVMQNQSLKIDCNQSANNNYMEWYRQQGSSELQLVLRSLYMNTPEYGNKITERFSITRSKVESITLTIDKVETSDTGLYFCASSDTVH